MWFIPRLSASWHWIVGSCYLHASLSQPQYFHQLYSWSDTLAAAWAHKTLSCSLEMSLLSALSSTGATPTTPRQERVAEVRRSVRSDGSPTVGSLANASSPAAPASVATALVSAFDSASNVGEPAKKMRKLTAPMVMKEYKAFDNWLDRFKHNLHGLSVQLNVARYRLSGAPAVQPFTDLRRMLAVRGKLFNILSSLVEVDRHPMNEIELEEFQKLGIHNFASIKDFKDKLAKLLSATSSEELQKTVDVMALHKTSMIKLMEGIDLAVQLVMRMLEHEGLPVSPLPGGGDDEAGDDDDDGHPPPPAPGAGSVSLLACKESPAEIAHRISSLQAHLSRPLQA